MNMEVLEWSRARTERPLGRRNRLCKGSGMAPRGGEAGHVLRHVEVVSGSCLHCTHSFYNLLQLSFHFHRSTETIVIKVTSRGHGANLMDTALSLRHSAAIDSPLENRCFRCLAHLPWARADTDRAYHILLASTYGSS